MSFDLCGEKPENELGEHFCNNMWWWPRLWCFVGYYCKDILSEKDFKYGCYNEGYLITRDKAKAIGERWNKLIHKGTVSRMEEGYIIDREQLPDEPCVICNGTGVRNDKVVQGKCNACNGKGVRENFNKRYLFTAKNVKKFAEFCLMSNGFRIY